MSGADGGVMETGLHSYTIGDLGVFIGTLGSVVTGILVVLQHSKCKRIKCCGCECERDLTEGMPKTEETKKLTQGKKKPTPVESEVEEIIKDADADADGNAV